MEYVGEHLLPGKIGHFFAVLSFAASFVAMISYFKATHAKTPEDEASWRRMARTAYLVDVGAVVAVLLTIIYIIIAVLLLLGACCLSSSYLLFVVLVLLGTCCTSLPYPFVLVLLLGLPPLHSSS